MKYMPSPTHDCGELGNSTIVHWFTSSYTKTTCLEHVLNVQTETKNIIFWVSWCTDTSFWKIFTCTFLFTIFLWRYQIEHTTTKGWKLKIWPLKIVIVWKSMMLLQKKIWPHYGMAGLSWVSSTESYSHHGPETRTSSLALSLSWFSGCIAIYYRVDQHKMYIQEVLY